MTNGGRGEMTDEARDTLSKYSNVFLPSPISSLKTTYFTLGEWS